MLTESITKGNYLIAKPSTYDVTFNRSIIIISEHTTHGSVGFILNKPTGKKVCDFIEDFDCNFYVFDGGPVEKNNLYYLHKRPDIISDSIKISDSVYWGGNYNTILSAVNNGKISENEIRFFLGYSGWETGQLQSELNKNAWLMVDDNIDIFKNWEVDLWQNQLKKLGGDNLLWINMPQNPTLN